MSITVHEYLDKNTAYLLEHRCEKVDTSLLHPPGPDWLDSCFYQSDRRIPVIRNMASVFSHGRLADTGYLSILPVDHGIEHSAGAAFSPNPIYFDPENIIKLAIEADCSAVASTLGVLGAVSRKYAHKIPFILKLNHNELLSYPNNYDQRIFALVKQAFEMGAVGVGATIYFGSEQSNRQIEQVSRLFERAHRMGLFTVLWCYLRNQTVKEKNPNLAKAADLTAQANHLGVTIEADIVKQKLPEPVQGFLELQYGKTNDIVYEDLMTSHPIDLVRYQVLNSFCGRAGLINSGGPSGPDDFSTVVETAVINKRAGGMGVICGRKAFQRPMQQGVDLLHAIQDVYLDDSITLA